VNIPWNRLFLIQVFTVVFSTVSIGGATSPGAAAQARAEALTKSDQASQ